MPRWKVESYGNMERYSVCEVEAPTKFAAHYEAHIRRPWKAIHVEINELFGPWERFGPWQE